jgi:DNA-binding Lrp family transcriptional regulator
MLDSRTVLAWIMSTMHNLDATDARLLLALSDTPRATGLDLAQRLGLSRNTVQARVAALEARGALRQFDTRVQPVALGYPLTAFITTQVNQHMLNGVGVALGDLPEVIEVHGLTGATDLLVRVVARDPDDLYRISALILGIPGVERTSIALSMREMVDYRVAPLLHRRVVG